MVTIYLDQRTASDWVQVASYGEFWRERDWAPLLGGARVPMHEMVGIDYLYVASWSLWLDLKVLLRTARHPITDLGLKIIVFCGGVADVGRGAAPFPAAWEVSGAVTHVFTHFELSPPYFQID
jgi:hypothetical protein